MLIYDLVDIQELQGFVRGVQIEEERNRFTLVNYLPNDNIDDIEYRITRGNMADEDAATIRTWDTEAPIGKRQGLSRIMGELPPISKKIRLGEEERLRKRALERGDTAQLERAIYNDAAKMARAVLARVELMRGEALHSAQIAFNENGVKQTVPFGRSASHSVAPATLWSTVATADPVVDMRSWVQTYIDTNGVAPAFALVSTAIVSNLLRNATFRQLAGSINGAPQLITVDTVQAILQAFGLPPLVTYDTKVRVAGVQTPVIPTNKLILMPPDSEPLGATLWGTTAESIELQEAEAIESDQAPGLVAVVMKTADPVATWTKGAGIALAVPANPDLTLTATVQ